MRHTPVVRFVISFQSYQCSGGSQLPRAGEEPLEVGPPAHQSITEANAGLFVQFDQVSDRNSTLVARPNPAQSKEPGGFDGLRQVFPAPGHRRTYANAVEKIIGPDGDGLSGGSGRGIVQSGNQQ